ncbi:hypothetical protein QL996_15415 [Planococcus sp. APC 4015]|nr:hypothetical protein [Planococcus sp. APC 4015]
MSTDPQIYGASELGVLSITAPGPAHPRVEYVGGELFVGLAEDGVVVTQGEAEDATVPFRAVLKDAVASVGPLPAPTDGVILIDDEAVAAGVLVEPERAAVTSLAGDPVLFALSRGAVAIVGADDEAGIGRVLDLAETLFDEGGALVSAHPVVLSDGAWAPFRWSERFPALGLRIERTLRLFSVRAYEAQSVALARPDVHLADPKIHVREDGVTLTFATWPNGTATLLPVVDNVMIADPRGSVSVATMQEFLAAAGDAVLRTGLSPLRYFVPGEAPR